MKREEFEELLRQLREGPTYVKKTDDDDVSDDDVKSIYMIVVNDLTQKVVNS